MVRHFEEIHEKAKDLKDVVSENVDATKTFDIGTGTAQSIALNALLEVVKLGTYSSTTGTASMGTASYQLQTGAGTGISADGYISVDIGGTPGYIPVLRRLV